MNKEEKQQHDGDVPPPPLQRSLAMGEALAQERSRDTSRRRVVRRLAPSELTTEQEDLLAVLLAPGEGEAPKHQVNVRLNSDLRDRLDRLVSTYRGLEKTRAFEVALDRLLSSLGF